MDDEPQSFTDYWNAVGAAMKRRYADRHGPSSVFDIALPRLARQKLNQP
jgi:hypothetical protein